MYWRTENLRPQLGTDIVGSRVAQYDIIDSTNLEALRLAEAGMPAGTVVIARTQTEGRGRLGRRWQDLMGRCLLMTVLVEPPEPPGLITAMGALAVARALEGLELTPQIKWPNDVLIDGRKVAGVLAEGPSRGLVALGIGVNVSGRPEELRVDLRTPAAFLSDAADRAMSVREVAERVMRELDVALRRLQAGGAGPLVEQVRERDCLRGRRITIACGGERIAGQAVEWLDDGRLAVLTDSGEQLRLEAGEVTIL